jgi:hypothetical protein
MTKSIMNGWMGCTPLWKRENLEGGRHNMVL